MSQSGKCNELRLLTSQLLDSQKDYYIEALKKASDKLIDLMEKEVLRRVHGDGPGKIEWRYDVYKKLDIAYEKYVNDFLEMGVGLPQSMYEDELLKAMVIAYGAGSAVGNPPITAGPPGRMVWDDNLDFKKRSEAKSEYALPKEFNQPGNHFVENAIKLMRKHFDDILADASYNLPDSYFYGAVHVSER